VSSRSLALVLAALALALTFATSSRGDENVVVSAFANANYTQRKYDGDKIRRETYVVMQGHFFEGFVVDKSIEKIPFRRIMDVFAPELARREYWPAKNLTEADLLIVVHWGTTMRQPSSNEMRARDSVITDMSESSAVITRRQLSEGLSNAGLAALLSTHDPVADQRQLDLLDQVADLARTDLGFANNAQLLGYTKQLRGLSTTLGIGADEVMLRSDLNSERYFIILKAYDLHEKTTPGITRRAIWTLHLNMRSPGTNFHAALDRMSATAVDYFGRATDGVTTTRSRPREGKVEVGTPIVIEDKPR
jgi:hypothetical protein